jgi:hypothetical protein
MLYPFQMSYCVHMNDSRLTLKPGEFITRTDDKTKEVHMSVSFDVDENDVVCMTTSRKLTYMSVGIEKSVSAGDKVIFPLDHVIVLFTSFAPTPRLEVCVVKKTAPRDPTPLPDGTAGLPSTMTQ